MLRVGTDVKSSVRTTRDLIEEWVEAKAVEAQAAARRKELEKDLAIALPNPKGTGQVSGRFADRKLVRKDVTNVSGPAAPILAVAADLGLALSKQSLWDTPILALSRSTDATERSSFELLVDAGLKVSAGAPQWTVEVIPG